MADLTRTQGSGSSTAGDNAGAFGEHHSGGNINFYNIAASGIHTSYTSVNSNWEKALKAMSGFGTIVVVGTPASNVAIVGLEGGDTSAATLTLMGTATTAASTISCTVTSVAISAAAFS